MKFTTYLFALFILASTILLIISLLICINAIVHPESGTFRIENFKNIKQNTMKKCTIVYPENQVDKVSTFLAENGIVTLVSYMKEDGFFNKSIVHVICFKDDLEDKVKANLNSYIKEKK